MMYSLCNVLFSVIIPDILGDVRSHISPSCIDNHRPTLPFSPPNCAAAPKRIVLDTGRRRATWENSEEKRKFKSPSTSLSVLLCNRSPLTCDNYFAGTSLRKGVGILLTEGIESSACHHNRIHPSCSLPIPVLPPLPAQF